MRKPTLQKLLQDGCECALRNVPDSRDFTRYELIAARLNVLIGYIESNYPAAAQALDSIYKKPAAAATSDSSIAENTGADRPANL